MGNPSSRAWGTGVRRNHPQCIANYDAPGPGISPLLKNRVSFDASIKPFHKTSLRLFVISRQQEGKEVETLCVFLEQFAKVLARRIQILSPLSLLYVHAGNSKLIPLLHSSSFDSPY